MQSGGDIFNKINFREKIEKVSDKEQEIGYTIVGPHTEGPVFLLNGKPFKNFASQGQKRSFLLSFKISQIIDYQKKNNKTPILLLDDLGSELDIDRQKRFFEIVFGKVKQIFFTTTDKKFLQNCGIIPDSCFHLNQGDIK